MNAFLHIRCQLCKQPGISMNLDRAGGCFACVFLRRGLGVFSCLFQNAGLGVVAAVLCIQYSACCHWLGSCWDLRYKPVTIWPSCQAGSSQEQIAGGKISKQSKRARRFTNVYIYLCKCKTMSQYSHMHIQIHVYAHMYMYTCIYIYTCKHTKMHVHT